MNKAQKEVQQAQLDEEKKVIRLLEVVYERAKKDCEQKIRELSARTDLENLQSIVYQKEYQQMMVDQLEYMIGELQEGQFTTIADYLEQSYINGYVGMFYNLQAEGIPLAIPIQQDQVVRALKTNSKLSSGLYKRLGEDVDYLKRSIRAELSRGISSGSSWNEIALRIARGMNSPFNKAINNAIRIARTEGHRIQNEAALDGQYKAKDKGADIVKQWDATLDSRTRPEHREADGQIRELDEPFDIGGEKMQAPGVGGSARNVCNCRCCLLQRAKWALDEDELKALQKRAAFFGLDKSKSFNDFKQKYLKLPDNADTINVNTLSEPVGSKNETYDRLFNTIRNKFKVKYNPVESCKEKLTEEDIIKTLSGGDETQGSCASVGLAYIAQKQGWNVHDFRGGDSQDFFSNTYRLKDVFSLDGMKVITAKGANTSTVGKNLLKQCEEGKEYYMFVGRHAAIVRLNGGKYQYLELQSRVKNGWKDFDGNVRYTLAHRFGCSSKSNKWSQDLHRMIDITDSDFDNDDFRALLGYINTSESEQKKGVNGYEK